MNLIYALSVMGQCFMQFLFCLVLAPVLQGILMYGKGKIVLHNTPSIWFPYCELRKLTRQQVVRPTDSTWVYSAFPWVQFVLSGLSLLLVPTIVAGSPLGDSGDIIVLVALLMLIRIHSVAAAWDSGNEAVFRTVLRRSSEFAAVNLILLFSLIAFCGHVGTLNLGSAIRLLAIQGVALLQPYWFLSLIAMSLLLLHETGKLSTPSESAALEREYSGPLRAVLLWGSWLRQLLLVTLTVNLFFPWGIAVGHSPARLILGLVLYLIKLGMAAMLIGAAERFYGSIRLTRENQALLLAAFLALLASFSNFLIKG